MKSYPFDSKQVNGSWDRAITAQDERDFNKLYFTNGVFASPTTSLLVEAYSGMQIKVLPGGCHIEGAKAYSGEARYITLSNSSSSLSRIDRVIARYDNSEAVRSIDIYVREGVPSTTPVAPDIHKEPEYYEIVLADVLIPKGVTSIRASYITDQRLNPDLCGLVVPMAKDNDTSRLWGQIKGSIELVNSALNDTTAGTIKNNIETISAEVLDLEGKIDNILSEDTLKAYEKLGWKRPSGGVLANLIGFIAHPIGSYYWSEKPTDPSQIFGGRWERVKDKFVYAAGYKSVGTTGGEQYHTLTIDEIPKHRHTVVASSSSGSDYSSSGASMSFTYNSSTKGYSGYTSNMGDGDSHNNMPPYIVAYCWKRIG